MRRAAAVLLILMSVATCTISTQIEVRPTPTPPAIRNILTVGPAVGARPPEPAQGGVAKLEEVW
jgi:hypothetical protein